MRLRDNTRAMLSATFGWAGGGIALAGWTAKAFTSRDASFTAKASIGAATALTVSAVTFAGFQVVAPSNLVFSSFEMTTYSTMANHALFAMHTGICTALSYVMGGSAGDSTPQRRTTLGIRR